MIREGREGDIPFIYSTWLKSYRNDSIVGQSCRKSVFFDNYKLVIDSILQKKSSKVLIATLNENDDVILGYVVGNTNTIHYVYIKEAWRGCGLASKLIAALLLDKLCHYTHLTNMSKKLINSRKDFVYNPFLLYER